MSVNVLRRDDLTREGSGVVDTASLASFFQHRHCTSLSLVVCFSLSLSLVVSLSLSLSLSRCVSFFLSLSVTVSLSLSLALSVFLPPSPFLSPCLQRHVVREKRGADQTNSLLVAIGKGLVKIVMSHVRSLLRSEIFFYVSIAH